MISRRALFRAAAAVVPGTAVAERGARVPETITVVVQISNDGPELVGAACQAGLMRSLAMYFQLKRMLDADRLALLHTMAVP